VVVDVVCNSVVVDGIVGSFLLEVVVLVHGDPPKVVMTEFFRMGVTNGDVSVVVVWSVLVVVVVVVVAIIFLVGSVLVLVVLVVVLGSSSALADDANRKVACCLSVIVGDVAVVPSNSNNS